jgi:lipid-binding SYLF domain-containing protein
MSKIMTTLVAAALLCPATLAFAGDSAGADAKKAGQEATAAGQEAAEAGEKAELAGEKAEQAGDRAERSTTRHHEYTKHDRSMLKHAREAVRRLQRADPGLTRFFDQAAGYAVFATVGKGGLGVGGAHGTGILFEKRAPTGKTSLTQVTIGLQIGGQAYTEVVFFENEETLAEFKKGQFTMAAQVSAVAAKAGASANAKYVGGVSVFTLAKGGMMAEASVGGQRLDYQAFQKQVAARDQ